MLSLDPTEQDTLVEQQSLSRQNSSNNISVSSEDAPKKELNSKDLGIKFFTTKGNGWPQNSLTIELINGVRSKKNKMEIQK